MNKAMKSVLKALSYGTLDVQTERRIAELKKLDPMRIFTKKLDVHIMNEGQEVPVRIYFPTEKMLEEELVFQYNGKVLLFFHGGGWVTESVETYDRVCSQMAQSTNRLVLSVEYRKAPEYRFPTALKDGFSVAKVLFSGQYMKELKPENITLIGDSAGGTLTAALSLMARDLNAFKPRQQILIYPALWNDYTENAIFPSIRDNGKEYLLTNARMEKYMSLYQRTDADRNNPYFAPLLAERFDQLPRTLVLTAEFDPLRDEGEEFARRLAQAGNDVTVRRIQNAMHGYFALGIKYLHVQESFEIINQFLKEE